MNSDRAVDHDHHHRQGTFAVGSTLVPLSATPNSANASDDVCYNSTDLLNEYQLDEYFSFLDDLTFKGEEFCDTGVSIGWF